MSPKLAEFYRRAEDDPGFRDRKLRELRLSRNFLLSCSLVVAALCASTGIYDGLTGEGWLDWNELVGLAWLAFGFWQRAHFARRIAVLEAMKVRDPGRAPA